MDASYVVMILLFPAAAAATLSFFRQILHRQRRATPSNHHRLPPGLPASAVMPLVRASLRGSLGDFCRVLSSGGPVLAVRLGRAPRNNAAAVLLTDAALVRRTLVARGAEFAGRPPAFEPRPPLITGLSGADYGPAWCALRHNLTTGILHPAAVKAYSDGRRQALSSLLGELRNFGSDGSRGGVPVRVRDPLSTAIFTVLVEMVLGERPGSDLVKAAIHAHRALLSNYNGLIFGLWPKIRGFLFPRRTTRILAELRQAQERIFIPLIRARREHWKKTKQQQHSSAGNPAAVRSYLDSLINLEIPAEKEDQQRSCRKLDDAEILTLCMEFVSAGAETTSTALEWILANVTRDRDIQRALLGEIIRTTAAGSCDNDDAGLVREENLPQMEYLNAVVTEGLRRHPPAYFLLPRAVSTDVTVGGYSIPRGSTVHCVGGFLGLDGELWRRPLEFRPERFLGGGGASEPAGEASGGGKMMPFGAGRRICPGAGLARLLLAYFTANLVGEFEWKAVQEEEQMDLSEQLGMVVTMKKPLTTRLCRRI